MSRYLLLIISIVVIGCLYVCYSSIRDTNKLQEGLATQGACNIDIGLAYLADGPSGGGGQAALAQRLLQPIFRKLKPQQWQIQNALLMDNRAMVVGIYCSGTQRQQERIKKLKVCIQIILR